MLAFLILPYLLGSVSPITGNEFVKEGIPLFYWHENAYTNFGDYISLKLVERIVGGPVRYFKKKPKVPEKKLLAVGSILFFATQGDIVWGSGVNGRRMNKADYTFTDLDIRAVRGPLTRRFIAENFNIPCPEIYGDPALLFPYFFPEFKRSKDPSLDYLIIPHYSERGLMPKEDFPNMVYPTDPWEEVLEKILDSKLVISSTLHGLVLAESYGIPARMLRISENEPLIKFADYYMGTNRRFFKIAYSIEEAIRLGGEKPFDCDLKKLYETFPFEHWPERTFQHPDFSLKPEDYWQSMESRSTMRSS
jgi:pyruvyltransferase